jgi:hypothetical protein
VKLGLRGAVNGEGIQQLSVLETKCTALLGPGSNKGSGVASPKAGLRDTLWYQCTESCGVIAHHEAARCLIKVTKRMRERRIRLRERRQSRLKVKLKLGYMLPAEAYL